MRIAVTGSIATDHLMTFPGKFVEQLIPDKLDKIALSFLVDSLVIRRGGVAANIAFGLGCLGLRPLLVGTAGADYLFCNEYEATLTQHKSGWNSAELTEQVGVQVTTLGSRGARIDRAGQPPILVPAVPGVEPREPTGAGDAFRSGFLAAISWGLSLERAAQLGNIIAVHALETTGTQEYHLHPEPLAARFATAYGDQAAADIARHFI